MNDDVIQGGAGFGEHPHNNMEIITIPLEGALAHKDSMSNTWIPLEAGEVQVMSAGRGIFHAEKNNSSSDFLNLFQIWIIPDQMDVEPRYEQSKFDAAQRYNQLQKLVTSISDKDSPGLKINQDAQISRIDLDAGRSFTYSSRSEVHGTYVMVVSGEISIGDHVLKTRDAMGISETESFDIEANEGSELLLIEVPMRF